MIHVCKNPEMGGGFHFLAHGLMVLLLMMMMIMMTMMMMTVISDLTFYYKYFDIICLERWLSSEK